VVSFLPAFEPNSVRIPLLSHSYYMPFPSHPPLLDRYNYTWRRVQITKLLVMQFSLHLSSLFAPNILLSTLFSITLSPCSLINVRDQVSRPYKIRDKVIVAIYVGCYKSQRSTVFAWNTWGYVTTCTVLEAMKLYLQDVGADVRVVFKLEKKTFSRSIFSDIMWQHWKVGNPKVVSAWLKLKLLSE
jgi:hypothetical protein